jgi:NADH-quinone oxidoreductase subunit A
MFKLLQGGIPQTTALDNASSYLPAGIQILIAVGLVTFLMVVTHLLGPKRKTSDKLENFASGIESHGDARQPMAIFFNSYPFCIVRCGSDFLLSLCSKL